MAGSAVATKEARSESLPKDMTAGKTSAFYPVT
ncbi:hypothetical protein SAMN05880590_102137 [Rhizobium sp. RU35A]|nr:hypothetical protein SAMN05880590_102137 [Rhizobium sp. RU35A]